MSEARPLIPASTILLVRDAPGLEVLMVERHHQIDFASGALVFPGGKVAPEDSDPRWAALVDDRAEEHERDYRIAAVREAFEESGILLARHANARGVGKPLVRPGAFPHASERRAEIAEGKASFLESIERDELVLALDTLVNYAHWITPANMPKRFDTRFYIAHTPEEQEELCDGSETVDAVWIHPDAAVAAAREGRRTIIFPTRLNLEMLAEAQSADDAMARSQKRKIVTVLPVVTQEADGAVLRIPEDAGYAVTMESMPRGKP